MPEPANVAFHILLLVIGALALATSRDLHHPILAYLALLLIAAYIGLLFAQLG